MNMVEKILSPAQLHKDIKEDTRYICTRVVDALLREDVRGCMSEGRIVDFCPLPEQFVKSFDTRQRWLKIDHFGDDSLWVPVSRHDFMQPWRLTCMPLLLQGPTGWRALSDLPEILAAFRNGLSETERKGFLEFEQECQTAVAHRVACEAERQRWFEERRHESTHAYGADLPNWEHRLLHYDRLAAFQDHPFYPTARAKLGFAVHDLRLYAPEFQPVFELNWLAVPRTKYAQNGNSLPPVWPVFADVGLPTHLASTHALIPVHPFVWENQLDGFLRDSGLAGEVLPAPKKALRVTPTLSVRTVALLDATGWHVKVPLTIRTLGGRNIRTIKPSTIVDGHAIQTLLGKIVEREPQLQGRIILTEEGTGAHVAQQTFLGFIVRAYPEEKLRYSTLVPVAALPAQAPSGQRVVDDVVERYFDRDRIGFLDAYLALTLRLHLLLWVRYGIALESNQQNSVLVLDEQSKQLSLLLKDNDAARIQLNALGTRWPELAALVAGLQDKRIVVEGELPLAQMFTTITLQLNIAALIETVAHAWQTDKAQLYAIVRRHIEGVLTELSSEGENVELARRVLLEDEHLYIKYLLIAATLFEKKATGAADVNKFYGRSAPNFLKEKT